ncbi:FG-GAP-like repeat-containing protein [Humibacillus xanthopallidus]|uniref:FG-GAP-like repeat-containing protein n=1 Tax=Humibacillus xanthopallidus TaxID=412689 RepID=UPI00384CD9CF
MTWNQPIVSARRRTHRRVTSLLACLTALTLAIGVVGVGAAPRAEAAVKFGHDISWPQCPTSVGGYGLPMPPTSTGFVIMGLTKGLPFTENPCLASQIAWVRSNSTPAHAYTMAGFPTAAQLTTYGASGPWRTTTRAARLSNVGYAEARYAAASLQRIAWRPPVVWIDVEPRSAQPWPTSSLVQRLENRYVLEGLMRGLKDSGFAYGVYSNTSGWQSITGSWWLPGVPVWATVGTLSYPNEALDKCTQPSFSGGRPYLSQWWDATRDYDRTCEPYAFTSFPAPPATLSNGTADFNGDWKNDVLARWTSTASLRLYAGTGSGTLGLGTQIGTGWGGMSLLETPGDLSGDGAHDVLARETATGYLWLYKGNGAGGWRLPRVRLGAGWGAMNAIVGIGDLTGDGRPDIVARQTSTGQLWLYPGTGASGWKPRVLVGTGWNAYSAVVGAGDLNGDGRPDLLARERATGYLWLVPGTSSGGLGTRVRTGTGWNSMTAILSPGDLNSDRVPDVLARDSTGRLWLYPRTATGGWLPRSLVSTGWNITNAIF